MYPQSHNKTIILFGSFIWRPEHPGKLNTKLDTFYKMSYTSFSLTSKDLFIYLFITYNLIKQRLHVLCSWFLISPSLGFCFFSFSIKKNKFSKKIFFWLCSKKEKKSKRMGNKDCPSSKTTFSFSVNSLDSLLRLIVCFILLFTISINAMRKWKACLRTKFTEQ